MLKIELTDWAAARAEASEIRWSVFVQEQGVPRELELDERDPLCLHALARDETGRAIGTARLLPPERHGANVVGHVGRMAVLRPWRGRGIGGALLERLIEAAAARGDTELALSAQTHALAFYRAHGFAEEGDEFLDAGIRHRTMRRQLQPARGNS
ncbi:MAG TPA: GNAT family N-acetyltransferase [Burkholderiales bacterium]|nr:GNAT family N-acetyltransferase [Burkholderiales bacterium]